MTNYIFIPGNVPSLKNSKQIFVNRQTGKRFIASSDSVKDYIKATSIFYESARKQFTELTKHLKTPLNIEFQFVRKTKTRFDFINMAQIVCDMMVKYNWIEDDSYIFLNPCFNSEVLFDKINSGVYVRVKA